ncbi:hypothetical protein [Emticicia sp. W12TSBA100-4]|uniref:hypothetical protein n=1 Tax=Emticicia sp. W12TSBA100-4 TaxID=3160965 RepID=UPI0033062E12
MSLINENDNISKELPIVDLAAILAQESQTVEKATLDFSDTDVRANYVSSDFSGELKNDTPENNEDVETETDVESTEPKRDNYFYKREAKRLVRLFDNGLRMGVRPLYKSLVLEPNDISRLRKHNTYLKTAKAQGVTEVISQDDDILTVLERYERLQEMCEGIPLSEDESEDLVNDLSEILKLRQKSFFSPEMSLTITCLVIIFARVEPVLSAKFKKMFP